MRTVILLCALLSACSNELPPCEKDPVFYKQGTVYDCKMREPENS